MLIADAGLLAWGAMAALAPDDLLGPGRSRFWPPVTRASPGDHGQNSRHVSEDAEYMTVLFRVYGAYCRGVRAAGGAVAATAFRRGDRWAWWALLVGNTIAFVSAMTYDWTVSAIGPFELTEYLGLALIWGALAVTAPFRAAGRPVPSPG